MAKRPSQPSSEFVGLLTAHQADLWAYIISLLPGDSEVADVLQKTNLVLWNEQKKFQTGTNFPAWAFAIARFEVLSHLKRKKRKGVVLLDNELLETIASEAPGGLESGELRLAALENCLKKLRPEDRELLDHRYQSHLGLETFSKRVGRSVSSLSVTLHRLRTELRKCIRNRIAAEGAQS